MRFSNATLPDGSRCDIEVEAGRIAALLAVSPAAPDAVDLGGTIVLPPLVDGHIHLDKTLLGLPWVPNQAAGNKVSDRIEAERRVRAARTVPEFETGSNLVRQVVASGTLHMRTHVDVDNQLGLRNLQEVLQIREHFRDLVTIEIVAFPQSGILRSPGTAELLDEAIAQGADLVGGVSTRSASTTTSMPISTPYSPSRNAAASESTSICTTAAKPAWRRSWPSPIARRRQACRARSRSATPSRWALSRPPASPAPPIFSRVPASPS